MKTSRMEESRDKEKLREDEKGSPCVSSINKNFTINPCIHFP